MRGIQTPVRNVRRRIFKEIAKFGYEQRNLQDLEDLPYEIVPGEVAKYRDSIYRERAIVGERLRLAMGMSLNPSLKLIAFFGQTSIHGCAMHPWHCSPTINAFSLHSLHADGIT